ncbi:hypothetical protein D3C85_1687530 [compost metagenome]
MFRPAGGVVEHRALLVILIASLVVGAHVSGVRSRQVQIARSLDGFRALADVAHQAPAGFRRVVLRADESDVIGHYRANPILIDLTGFRALLATAK